MFEPTAGKLSGVPDLLDPLADHSPYVVASFWVVVVVANAASKLPRLRFLNGGWPSPTVPRRELPIAELVLEWVVRARSALRPPWLSPSSLPPPSPRPP
jgi:hypothetical protein